MHPVFQKPSRVSVPSRHGDSIRNGSAETGATPPRDAPPPQLLSCPPLLLRGSSATNNKAGMGGHAHARRRPATVRHVRAARMLAEKRDLPLKEGPCLA